MTIALDIKNIGKHYTLYPGHANMVLDWAGYYKARFWRPRPVFPVKKALDNVSLQINRGDRVGLIGRNGAGKTTLLKIAAGMISPSSGNIDVHGTVQTLMRLGAAFHPDFSGAENIRHSLLYNNLRGRELEKAFDDIADFVELGDFLHQPVRTYSLGMGSRLQFAVATAVTPDILIIDEVLGAGDAYFSAKSADRMRRLTKSGCTLLLVSHSRAQIMEFCTSAIWLDQGKVRQQGEMMAVTTAYDRAIAEAINYQGTPSATAASLLPIPGYLRHPDYLNHISGAVDALKNSLSWEEAYFSGAQRQGACLHPRSRIRDVRFLTAFGHATNHFSTGDTFSMQVTMDAPSSGPVACRLMVFGNGGDLIAMTHSPDMPAGTAMIQCDLPQLPLGHREYLLAVILEIRGQPQHALAGLYLKIMETNDSDPPLLHYPAKWYQNSGENPVPSRISGIQ